MARFARKFKYQSHQCKRGCGTWHNEWIYVHKSGTACSRTFGTKKGPFAFDRSAKKTQATYRVKKVGDKWQKDAKNPAWKDTKPVQVCCRSKPSTSAKVASA